MSADPNQQPTPQSHRRYVCYRSDGPAPPLDGRLDKPFWRRAPWSELFLDIEGDAKPRPRHDTRFKMLWDDRWLYIGAQMDEPHVWATLTQRDSIVYHDNDFEVFLNPTGDNHRYYELEINALGTIFDLFLPKPYRDAGKADHEWDVRGLLSAVHIDGTLNEPGDTDKGWSVELAMPWGAFDRHREPARQHLPPQDGEQWRINFSRVQWDLEVVDGKYSKIKDRPEHNWVWSPQGIIDMHRPEQWGTVQFSCVTAGEGEASFVPNGSMEARKWLHTVYYAQRRFMARHEHWAEFLADLEIEPSPRGAAMSRTKDGWTASVPERRADGGACTWNIRADSLVWRQDR